MPARCNYKTEEDYEKELKKMRDARRYQIEHTVNSITLKAKGVLPELTEEELSKDSTIVSAIRSEKAERIASSLRRDLLRKWHSTFKGNCIIVIYHVFSARRNIMYYTVELTSFGATLKKDWLKDELRARGLEITGYNTQRDLAVYYGKGV